MRVADCSRCCFLPLYVSKVLRHVLHCISCLVGSCVFGGSGYFSIIRDIASWFDGGKASGAGVSSFSLRRLMSFLRLWCV